MSLAGWASPGGTVGQGWGFYRGQAFRFDSGSHYGGESLQTPRKDGAAAGGNPLPAVGPDTRRNRMGIRTPVSRSTAAPTQGRKRQRDSLERQAKRRYRSMADYQLPKLGVRVRFPLPAPRRLDGPYLRYPFLLLAAGQDGQYGCAIRAKGLNTRPGSTPGAPARGAYAGPLRHGRIFGYFLHS